MDMPLHPTWDDIALRLVLTIVAGGVIGLNRGVHGHAAGLRTTILVGLAAAVAMVQANLLLSVSGKTPESFGIMDLMRLPLGILTGVGFIGGGSILKRGNLVTGVTTAATLWAITVIGLCFGGGQIWLGIAATVLGVGTLSLLKPIDDRIPREHRAVVIVRTPERAPPEKLTSLLLPLGYSVRFLRQTDQGEAGAQFCYELRWKRAEISGPPTKLLELLNRNFAVVRFSLLAEED